MFCWWTAWLPAPIKSFVIFLTLSHLFEKEIYTHKHTCTTLWLNKLRLGLAQNHTANSGKSWDIIKNSGGVGSRWQNKRTWNSPLFTNTSRIHLQMEQISQSTCWILLEDLGHLKGQEKSPHNQVGLEKEKQKEEMRRDQHPWGELKVRRASCTQRSPLTVGKSAGTQRELWGVRGECSNWSVEGRTE